MKPTRFNWDWAGGFFALRIGRRRFRIHAPWRTPLFSERSGALPVRARFLGWRFLVQHILRSEGP